MYRFALQHLESWKDRLTRKPLVVRGARQVGKSFLVRMFAEKHFDHLLEINFEQNPDAATLFESKSPTTILSLLEARFGVALKPGKGLLFLDEIQAAPQVFAALRYFHEQMPGLHVTAAGSLLEFILEEHRFPMPVGRIEYLHLGPMQFEEFLLALDRNKLREYLCDYIPGEPVPEAIHRELLSLLRRFLIVGGLPESVWAFANTGSFQDCDVIKQSVLSTYRDDFNKYRKRVDSSRIDKVFMKVPQLVGRKFKYSQVDRQERSRELGRALSLLCLARVSYRVLHTSANGLPLGAEADARNFKVLFLDVGLLSRSCGLGFLDLEGVEDVMLVNSGAVCEQFVGQHLLYSREFYSEPELYYWMRERKSSSAEVDYVISVGQSVIPVEVKAGKTGTLRSLHMFLREKKLGFGLRFNTGRPSIINAETSLPNGADYPFTLLSLPLYMVGQARRLCRDGITR